MIGLEIIASGPNLQLVPIRTVEVPIGTPQVPNGIVEVLTGTLQCSAQFPLLVHFGLFFGHFSGLGIVFGHLFKICIPNKIHFNLIIKSLKNNYLKDNCSRKPNY